MNYVRIYCDDTGETHFEDVTVRVAPVVFAPPAPPLWLASPVRAKATLLGTASPGWYGDWHPTPARQFYIQLSGELEAEASDGEKRTFVAGSVVLLEDTEGRGHRSRVVGEAPVSMVFVQLDETGIQTDRIS